MAINEYSVLTHSVQLQGSPAEVTNDQAQQGAAMAIGGLLQTIATTEKSGKPVGPYPAVHVQDHPRLLLVDTTNNAL